MARNVTGPKGEAKARPERADTIFSGSVDPAYLMAATAAFTALYPTTEPRRG